MVKYCYFSKRRFSLLALSKRLLVHGTANNLNETVYGKQHLHVTPAQVARWLEVFGGLS